MEGKRPNKEVRSTKSGLANKRKSNIDFFICSDRLADNFFFSIIEPSISLSLPGIHSDKGQPQRRSGAENKCGGTITFGVNSTSSTQ